MDTNKQAETLQLVEFLETYLPVIDSRIPTHINAGGCGIFAKLLHENLLKMGFDTKIVFIAAEKDQETIERVFKNNKYGKDDKRSGFEHCMVALSDYIYLDSDGVTLPPQLKAKAIKGDKDVKEKLYVGEISVENLQVYIDHKDSWSPVFDRDCVPQITEELSKLSEEFENFKNGRTEGFELATDVKFTEHTIKYVQRARMAHFLGNI